MNSIAMRVTGHHSNWLQENQNEITIIWLSSEDLSASSPTPDATKPAMAGREVNARRDGPMLMSSKTKMGI